MERHCLCCGRGSGGELNPGIFVGQIGLVERMGKGVGVGYSQSTFFRTGVIEGDGQIWGCSVSCLWGGKTCRGRARVEKEDLSSISGVLKSET